jgi:hypothetical protein
MGDRLQLSLGVGQPAYPPRSMLASATALFVEYLVIGSAAWLWLAPVLIAFGPAWGAGGILQSDRALAIGSVVVATYVLGVTTESLSWGLERLVFGRTSSPRPWVRKRLLPPSDADWHAAQHWIWKSDQAYKEFIYSRLRVMISRGIATNAGLAAILSLVASPLRRYLDAHDQLFILVVVDLVMAMLATLSWFLGTLEYRARVKVAGAIPQP